MASLSLEPTLSIDIDKQHTLPFSHYEHQLHSTLTHTTQIPDDKIHPNSTPSDLAAEALDAEYRFYRRYPNRWCYIRETYLRDASSEFFGCMILLLIGAGVDCQVYVSGSKAVSANPDGTYLSASFGWAAGAAAAIWVAMGSGGHINPAVTLTFAVFRGFSWRKVPVYIAAQVCGAWTGAMLVYTTYYHALKIADPLKTKASASLFSTYPVDYLPSGFCWFNEFIGTIVLVMVVLAVTDRANGTLPPGFLPVIIFFTLLAIGTSLGMQTGYALNPARDFGPRIALWMVGYGGDLLFTYRNLYWLWCPISAPIVGALTAAGLYDIFIYTGRDSPLNQPSNLALKYSGRPMSISHAKEIV